MERIGCAVRKPELRGRIGAAGRQLESRRGRLCGEVIKKDGIESEDMVRWRLVWEIRRKLEVKD